MNLLLVNWGRRGGGPRMTLELLRDLQFRNEIRLFTSFSRQADLFAELAAVPAKSAHVDTYTGLGTAILRILTLPAMLWRISRFTRENQIDTALCTMTHYFNIPLAICLRLTGARYVLIVHDARLHPGENPAWLRNWLIGREISLCDGIVTLTNFVRREVAARHKFPPERIAVIPHGVFTYADEATRRQSKSHAPQNRPLRLLFFGRLLAYRGLWLLCGAMRILHKRKIVPELSIYGSGPRSTELYELAEMPGVTLHKGYVPESEIATIFSAHDLCLLSSTEASQSGVIPVAYDFGMPVIATPVGGLPEQVEHETSGLIAEETTPEAFADAIERMLADRALYDRCAEGARRLARSSFAWSTLGPAFIKHCLAIYNMPPRGRAKALSPATRRQSF